MKKKELKKQAQKLKPVVMIGKAGLTDAVVAEVKGALKRDKLIKIKMSGGAVDSYDKADMIQQLVELTNSDFVEKKGHTIVLYKA